MSRRSSSKWRPRTLSFAVTFGALLLLAVQPGRAAAPPAPFADAIARASHRFGIPDTWIRAVIAAESGGDPTALSPAGAVGLMQVMPSTYAELRQRYGLGADPFDVSDNVTAGAAYLRELYDHYGVRGMLAAYNAGPRRWEEHLVLGRALPGETQRYLARLAPRVGLAAPAPPPTRENRAPDRLFIAVATLARPSESSDAAARRAEADAARVSADLTQSPLLPSGPLFAVRLAPSSPR